MTIVIKSGILNRLDPKVLYKPFSSTGIVLDQYESKLNSLDQSWKYCTFQIIKEILLQFSKNKHVVVQKSGTTSSLRIHLCSHAQIEKPAFKNHTRSPQWIYIFFFLCVLRKNNHTTIAVCTSGLILSVAGDLYWLVHNAKTRGASTGTGETHHFVHFTIHKNSYTNMPGSYPSIQYLTGIIFL